MARFYAQFCTLIFAVVTVVGTILGNAVAVTSGVTAHGNLGSITLQMTWARDAVDLVLLLAFIYVGFLASRQAGRWTMVGIGVVLVGLAVIGFATGDNDQASKAALGMHFPVVMNIFDTVTGVLALLTAAGTLSDDEIPQGSIIRPGTPAPGAGTKSS